MAATETTAPAEAGPREPNHGLRIFLIWLPLALAADLIIWFVWGRTCRRARSRPRPPASRPTSP